MIGGGSKLPGLVSASKNRGSRFEIKLVVTHKAKSQGIDFAISKKIPAFYFNLVDFRSRITPEENDPRSNYMKILGWFISQKEYAPKLLVFAGWDLVMDENFFNFFKGNIGNGFSAINLHPAILPHKNEGEKVKLPDGTYTPVIKGEQQEVLEMVLAKKITYFGPTVHFMMPTVYDTGEIIERSFIKVGNAKTVEDLRQKLLPEEDEILISSINKVAAKLAND